MSDRIKISRRQVMQMGIAAPLVALAARGASSKELEAAAMVLPKIKIPEERLTKFKGKSKKWCEDPRNGCIGFDETKYGEILLVLWAYFDDAVEKGGAEVPPEGSAALNRLVDAAFDAYKVGGTKESGYLIAERMEHWGDIYEHVTNYCAYRCGLHAAKNAGAGNQVEPDHYRTAFKTTSEEMSMLVFRIPGDEDKMKAKGGGC